MGTKFFTIPWTNFLIGGGFRLGRDSVLKALRVSLERLQVSSVPLYQVRPKQPAQVTQTGTGAQSASERLGAADGWHRLAPSLLPSHSMTSSDSTGWRAVRCPGHLPPL